MNLLMEVEAALFPESSLISTEKIEVSKEPSSSWDCSPTRPQARGGRQEMSALSRWSTPRWLSVKQAWCQGQKRRRMQPGVRFSEKWPLLAPRWACMGLHSSPSYRPLQRGTSYLSVWVQEMFSKPLTAKRIQVIHLNPRTVSPLLEFIPETQGFAFCQLEQRPKVSSKIKDYLSK